MGIPLRPWDLSRPFLDHVAERSYPKRLEEDPSWVVRVNRRAARPWRTVTGQRSVSAKCWSYALSYAID